MNSYSIDLVGVSKEFKRATRRGAYTTIKSEMLSWWKKSEKEILTTHALKNITMRVPKGASVGVIGRNGSGKSTLLKLITGIYKADAGKVFVNGRVSALIELGAGFHPDFTGRENIFLAGVMQGMTKAEVTKKFQSIVEFAELEGVIDDPVRTYSSGMFMRLGFSVAIHADPDVLLIDEVLAVGDAGFVAKCRDRIGALRKEGKTLMLVAHDLESIERWSDEVLWIDKGEIKERGEPRRVIDAYRTFIEKGEEAELQAHLESEAVETQSTNGNSEVISEPKRWGSREIEITKIELLGKDKTEHNLFHPDDSAEVKIHFVKRETVSDDIVCGIGIHRSDGLLVYGTNTHIERINFPKLSTSGVITFNIKRIGLLEGSFTLDVALHREDGYPYDYHRSAKEFLVRSQTRAVGVCEPEHWWQFG